MIAGFELWLHNATRGLPHDLADLIQDELSAHYEEAIEEYTRRGYNPDDAHQAALSDLGDPALTAQGLHLIHMSRRRYLLASIASLLPLVPMFCVISLVARAGEGIFQNRPLGLLAVAGFMVQALMVIVSVSYGLKTFKPLLGLSSTLETPRRIITLGLTGLLIPCAISQMGLATNHANVMLLINDPIVYYYAWGSVASLAGIYDMVIGVTMLVIAFGWLMAGVRLNRLDWSFFLGVGPLVTWMFLISGFGLLTMGASILFDNRLTLFIATLIIAIGSPIKAALMAFLFFRAAYRHEPYQPLRT